MFLAVANVLPQETADPVFERLAKVDRFAFGGIGVAGTISQGEKDYKVILSRPSALADFERLLSTGNVQARAYALGGIRKLDGKVFKELARPLRDSKEEVVTQSGCIQFHESLGAVLKLIDTGVYSKRM
jgi:hypothetical protein